MSEVWAWKEQYGGLILRQLMTGEPTVEALEAFAPTRFWSW